jgi:hypothetical protein
LNREDIIRIARQAGVRDDEHRFEFSEYKYLERFAALVIANHPPQSYMSWQEGHEAGRITEREACAQVCDSLEEQCEKLGLPDEKWPTPADCASVIRARSSL